MVCTHSCHTQEGHRQDQNVCRPVSTKQVCQEREVPIHHPSPGRCQHRCRKRKTFTKLDAMKGYHQCPLDEASQLLTNSSYPSVGSNTSVHHMASPPFQSIVTTGWMKHSLDEAFAGLTGYRCIVDDVVIYDSNPAQHTDHVRQFLQWCAERKITLTTTLDKWQFAQ